MDLSFYEFVGDGLGNDDIVDITSKILEAKYNKKFIAKRIGERYGKDEDDTATLYYAPEDDENFIFSVKYNLENKNCSDNYLYREVCYEIEKNINMFFKENNINSLSRIDIIKKNTLEEEMNVESFIEKYQNTSFLGYIIIENNIQDKINGLLERIKNLYPNIKIGSYIFEAKPEEFKILKEDITDLEYFSKSMVRRYVTSEPEIYRVEEGNIIKVK